MPTVGAWLKCAEDVLFFDVHRQIGGTDLVRHMAFFGTCGRGALKYKGDS